MSLKLGYPNSLCNLLFLSLRFKQATDTKFKCGAGGD